MGEWKEYKLGDLGTIITGKTPSAKNPEDWGNEMLFVTPTDYCNYRKYSDDSIRKLSNIGIKRLKNKILPPSSILVTCIGSDMGKVVMTKSYCITNQQINSIIPNNLVNPDFLYYTLISSYDTLRILGGDGTAVPIINKNDFSNISINIPSLSEQKRIAFILGSLDDKIDLLHRENETLEAMAETLFRKWFIEDAKDEWKEGKLGDEFNFIMGQSPKGESFNEEEKGIPMYQGNADFGFRFPTRRIFTTEPTRIAEEKDTLISVRAPVGAQNMAIEKCCIGRGLAAFKYKKDNLAYYSYTYYKLKSLLDEIKQFNDNGTVFGSISKSDFNNLDIIIPDLDIIIKFQNIVKPIDDKIINNDREIKNLIKLRNGLLSKLILNNL